MSSKHPLLQPFSVISLIVCGDDARTGRMAGSILNDTRVGAGVVNLFYTQATAGTKCPLFPSVELATLRKSPDDIVRIVTAELLLG